MGGGDEEAWHEENILIQNPNEKANTKNVEIKIGINFFSLFVPFSTST